jgi:hypothetical protein
MGNFSQLPDFSLMRCFFTFKTNNHIHISINDNGIGKETSRKFNTHGTGMGIKTVEKIIHHYNKINKSKINYVPTKNQPHGLKVDIEISF